MAKQVIDIGLAADDGTGDPGRTAFDKVNDNFTELYTLSLNSSGTVDGTDQLFTGHIAVGSTASVDANTLITGEGTVTDPGSSFVVGMKFDPVITGTPFIGASFAGYSTTPSYESTPTIDNAVMYGVYSVPTQNSAKRLSKVAGIYSRPTTKAGSGVVTDMYGLEVDPNAAVQSTNGYGVYVKAMPGTAIKAGIWLDPQFGATNNYGIVLDGDDLGADIVFGAGQDVSMHYDGTNMTLEGSGITRSADTTSTITGTIPIDINGTVYKIMLTT